MKKMIVSAFALTMFAAAANAQDVDASAISKPVAPVAVETTPAQPAATTTDEKKTKVEIAALPEAVQKALVSDAYHGWTIATAWQVQGPTSTYYILEMKKGDENLTVKLDQEGKQIG